MVCQDFKYDHKLYKGYYFMGKVAQIRQIFEEKISKSLPVSSQEYRSILFFF
jgi:hypothetical protein